MGSKNKVCIICPEHGEFWQTPNAHLSGQGCLYCGVEGKSQKRLCTEKEFIEKANRIHNYTYDYSKIIYRGVDKQIEIICPKHGEFWQTPHSHLNGHGCQKCRESKLERDIRFLLEENNINYIYQASKKDLEWLGYLSFDFFIYLTIILQLSAKVYNILNLLILLVKEKYGLNKVLKKVLEGIK